MSKKIHLIALSGLSLILTCCASETKESKPTENAQTKTQTESAMAAVDSSTKNANETDLSAGSQDESTKSQIDVNKLSEAFGNFIGRNLKAPGVNFDLDNIIKGMREGYAGNPSPLSDQEYETMMAAFQEKALKVMSQENLKAANEFLTKNAKEKKTIVIVPEKLQYTILKEGTGPAVKEHSTPKLRYSGKYLDGTIFGSSDETGGPVAVPLDQTIPGFSQGIVGMKEGEQRRLFVHPDLGFGTSGQLPPNQLLIYDIEVIKADEPQAPPSMPLPIGNISNVDSQDYNEDESDDELN